MTLIVILDGTYITQADIIHKLSNSLCCGKTNFMCFDATVSLKRQCEHLVTITFQADNNIFCLNHPMKNARAGTIYQAIF